jgi:hypothetical protein
MPASLGRHLLSCLSVLSAVHEYNSPLRHLLDVCRLVDLPHLWYWISWAAFNMDVSLWKFFNDLGKFFLSVFSLQVMLAAAVTVTAMQLITLSCPATVMLSNWRHNGQAMTFDFLAVFLLCTKGIDFPRISI